MTITVPPGQTRLILRPDDEEQLTIYKLTDARTAMARGLAEYCSQLRTDLLGRETKFMRCFESWAESEENADLPSMAVIDSDPGIYEENSLAPTIAGPRPDNEVDGPNPHVYLVGVSELSVDFTIDVVATNTEERFALISMLEDAFNPVDWKAGFNLELPHYHNARASFTPISMQYLDTEQDAQARVRRAVFKLNGRVPVFRTRDRINKAQVIGGRLAGITVVVEIVEGTVRTGTAADEEASRGC